MNQIIEVPDIAVLKTENGTKRLYSLREQKIAKNAVLQTFDIGSGVKYGGDLYVLDNPDMEIVRMTTGKVDPSFTISKTSDIRVDWGDGVVEKNVFAHTYTDGLAVHEITFWGKRTALTSLDCYDNQLTQLDVSANVALRELYCNNNQLIALDVSKNTALTSLDCYDNQLTQLDVSANVVLRELHCDVNQLTALDVSKNTALTRFWCEANQLTTLNVSKNVTLIELYCNANQLTALDVSKNTALTRFWCNHNQLTTLNVSKNVALATLMCDNNQLTALDVSNNVELFQLCCKDNPFIINPPSLTTMVNSLPDRNGMEQGILGIGLVDMDTQSVIVKKNWFPGQ